MNKINFSIFMVLITTFSVSNLMFYFEGVLADEVIDTIPVGNYPLGIAYHPDNGNLYVVNYNDRNVSVIDGGNNTVVDTIMLNAEEPRRIASIPDSGFLYVEDEPGVVSVIDGNTNTVISKTEFEFPNGIEYNPDNGNIYMSVLNDDFVYVIDGNTNTVIDSIDTIEGGGSPKEIVYNPDNGNLYVINYSDDIVSVIDGNTNTVIDTILVVGGPTGIVYNPDNGNIYVTMRHLDKVYVIDEKRNNVIHRIGVDDFPNGIEYNPDNGNIYVTNSMSNTVSVIGEKSST